MSVNGTAPTQPIKKQKCIHCKRYLKTFKRVFPLGNSPIHYHCLIKEIEKNEYPDYSLLIPHQLYIEDTLSNSRREAYLVKDKLYSNRETYIRCNEKHAIIRVLNSGILGRNQILGGQVHVPYSLLKNIFAFSGKHYLIYYIASKIKLLSPAELLDFYNNKDLIDIIFHSEKAFFEWGGSCVVLFNFRKPPPETIQWWLNTFCPEHTKVSYRTSTNIIENYFCYDKTIAIKGTKFDIPEDRLRENVLKFLKGEEYKIQEFSKISIKQAFQGKGLGEPETPKTKEEKDKGEKDDSRN